ncbi:MAG: hypothetical protein IJ456_03060 [Bacteroides sp.]|nr:hypothetical protein [Bacteroides sp.]
MKLNIGPIIISIEGMTEADIPENSRLFLTKDSRKADVCYRFHWVEVLPSPESDWKEVFRRPDICVWQNGSLEARRLAVGTPDAAYALYKESSAQETEVYFLESLKRDLRIDTIFVSCLALERQMAAHGGYILHCCYLSYRGQGVLFSGPSGIGKSTHASLWCRYLNEAHVVNGDRCLIYKNPKGEYTACPWPVCGSSGICRKEEWPVRAIVFMAQAPHNEIREASPMQLFKMLSSQLTVNWWNANFTRKALDAAQEMLERVGMCTYACNLSEEAPRMLNNYLKEKEWII